MFRYYKSFIFPKGHGVTLIAFLFLALFLMKVEACQSTQFFDGTNCFNCSSAISNCRACSNQHTCTACAETHYLDSGACIICSSANVGCETCVVPNICLKCMTGYHITGNSSIGYTCQFCNTTFPNCTLCSNSANNVFCNRCQAGFYSSSLACVPCSQVASNCLQCNMWGCNICEPSYFFFYNRCYQRCTTSSHCQLCPYDNNCQRCQAYYAVFNGQCILCSQVMLNCQECSDLNTCTACIPNTTCILAETTPSNNSSSSSNETNLNGTNSTDSGTNSTNSSSSPANTTNNTQNNNIPSNNSSSSNSAQVSTANSDAQSSSSTLIAFAAGLVAGLVAGSIVTAIVVLVVKKITAPSVGQKITAINSALNASASQAKEIRIENMQESFNNIHNFQELPPNAWVSPSGKGGRQPSARMPQESKRKILKINEDILEDSYE